MARRKFGKFRKKKNLFGTKPSFQSRQQRVKRKHNLSTSTMWFASSGTVVRGQDGRSGGKWSPMAILTGPQFPGLHVPNYQQLGDFHAASTFHSHYKILAFQIRLFAANVGTEGGPNVNLALYNRGNTIVYTVANAMQNQAYQNDIQDVITKGSAVMIPSRQEKYKRVMYRPKGFPGWGSCDTAVPIGDRKGDQWTGQIILLGQNATPLDPADMWFYTMKTKVIFRGRRLSVATP